MKVITLNTPWFLELKTLMKAQSKYFHTTAVSSHMLKTKKPLDSGPESEGPKNPSLKNKKSILSVLVKSLTGKNLSRTAAF
jgi:hypothetical protein